VKRKIIEIDDARCDGCGECIDACHEGALALVDGKARLVTDTYCDGLGACIGDCPRGALTVVEREAVPFDAALVAARLAPAAAVLRAPAHAPEACPGSAPAAAVIRAPGHAPEACPGSALRILQPAPAPAHASADQPGASALAQWPVQLMLVPPHAPFLAGADLLVCADCVPFAVPDFHARYLTGRAVVVGCPKLDDLGHYRAKLAAMVQTARPRRLTVARMEVPCCRGITQATVEAAQASEPQLTVEEHVVGLRGSIERTLIGPTALPR
jgi:ferredoxin